MKSKEELEQIKEKYVELNKKLKALTEEELNQVVGGMKVALNIPKKKEDIKTINIDPSPELVRKDI